MAQSVVDRSTQHSTVSETVVSAVAELTDSEPVSLEPLFATIDSDALNRLFGADGGSMAGAPKRVEFTYCGCEVVVSADGTVRASRSGREISKSWT